MSEIGLEDVKNIYPLNRLSADGLYRLSQGMSMVEYPRGKRLFEIGDTPEFLYYVLGGRVELHTADTTTFMTVGPEAGFETIPLPYMFPSEHAAWVAAPSRILVVNRKLLDAVIFIDQPDSAQAVELSYSMGSATGDWTKAFFRARGYRRVPRAEIEACFSRAEPMEMKRGQVFIHKNDPADYLYIISRGTVHVMSGKIKLAEYGIGATVGEDGLISGLPRNASVVMAADGEVVRISSDDFHKFIKPHMLKSVSYENTKSVFERGGKWLDVRLHGQTGGVRLRNSISVPYPIIRSRLFAADPNHPYVVVCATERDSPVISFMLNKYGFESYYLTGGFKTISPSEHVAG